MKTDAGVVVLGAGGHGREVLGVVRACGLRCAGLMDDGSSDTAELARLEIVLLGPISPQVLPSGARVVIGVGAGPVRRQLDGRFPTAATADPLVHPAACLDGDVRLAPGAVVFALATVTTNIDVGRHTHIGRGAAVGHDCVLGDYATVMPLAAVSGNVTIGDDATIGTGAVIRQQVTIGAGAFVGAGAVVVEDVPPGVTVVGNPARPLRR